MNEFCIIENICCKINIPNRKKKIISYSYILHKIFQKLGYTHLNKYIHYPLYTKNIFLTKIWNKYIRDEYEL